MQLQNCRDYLTSGDLKVLHPSAPGLLVPHHDPEQLARRLDDPTIRSFLAFAPENAKKARPLTQISNGLLSYGLWLLAGGFFMGTPVLVRAKIPEPPSRLMNDGARRITDGGA
jgi:hypothetical protein